MIAKKYGKNNNGNLGKKKRPSIVILSEVERQRNGVERSVSWLNDSHIDLSTTLRLSASLRSR